MMKSILIGNINFYNFLKKVFVALLFLLGILSQQAFSETCNFDYLAKEVPLFSEYTQDLTEKLQTSENEGAIKYFKVILPNFKRFFGSKDPKFALLLGWEELPEDYSRFSRPQVENTLRQMAEKRVQKDKAKIINNQIKVSDSNPATLYFILNYFDKKEEYRDTSINIVATPKCLLSIIASGKLQDLNQTQWQSLEEQFELIREAALKKEGNFLYSGKDARFSVGTLIYLIKVFGMTLLFAGMFFTIYRLFFTLKVGQDTRIYSLTIMGLSIFNIIGAILENEFGTDLGGLRYENVPHFLILLATHFWSYRSASSKITLFGISLVIGSFLSNVILIIHDPAILTNTPTTIGLILGVIIVTYTLISSSNVQIETDGKKKNLLIWSKSPANLRNQVENYQTLHFTESYRGVSVFIVLLLLGIVLLESFIFTNPYFTPEEAFLGLIGYTPFLFFAYRGHRWAIIFLMLFYTIENGYGVYNSDFKPFIFLIWTIEWYFAELFLWRALQVEFGKRKMNSDFKNELSTNNSSSGNHPESDNIIIHPDVAGEFSGLFAEALLNADCREILTPLLGISNKNFTSREASILKYLLGKVDRDFILEELNRKKTTDSAEEATIFEKQMNLLKNHTETAKLNK